MCQSLNLFYVLNATTILRVINSDQLKIILYSFVLYIYILNLESSPPQKKKILYKITCDKERFFTFDHTCIMILLGFLNFF